MFIGQNGYNHIILSYNDPHSNMQLLSRASCGALARLNQDILHLLFPLIQIDENGFVQPSFIVYSTVATRELWRIDPIRLMDLDWSWSAGKDICMADWHRNPW